MIMFSFVIKFSLLFLCIAITEAFLFPSRVVSCGVSPWSRWGSPNNANKQTRVRRIMRHPGKGGKPCPPLIEARDSKICRVTGWSAWSTNFGFGQQTRVKSAIPKYSARRTTCSASTIEQVRYTDKAPSLINTANNFRNFFMRPSGRQNTSAAVRRLSSTYNSLMPRDLVLIMDSSGSITKTRFDDAKDQLSRLVGLLCPTSPFDKIAGYPYLSNQAAMLTFSTYVVKNFDFNKYDTTVAIQNAIRNVAYVGKYTNTHLAFDGAKGFFYSSKGARPKDFVKREVLILTDGRSSNKDKTLEAVETLKTVADVYGLMIGSSTFNGKEELTKYVSTPIDKHLFYLENFGDLEILVTNMEKKASSDALWCAPFNRI